MPPGVPRTPDVPEYSPELIQTLLAPARVNTFARKRTRNRRRKELRLTLRTQEELVPLSDEQLTSLARVFGCKCPIYTHSRPLLINRLAKRIYNPDRKTPGMRREERLPCVDSFTALNTSLKLGHMEPYWLKPKKRETVQQREARLKKRRRKREMKLREMPPEEYGVYLERVAKWNRNYREKVKAREGAA